jgi:hypothetical protein
LVRRSNSRRSSSHTSAIRPRRRLPRAAYRTLLVKLPCLIGWRDDVYTTVGHRLTHFVLHAGPLGEELRENYAGGLFVLEREAPGAEVCARLVGGVEARSEDVDLRIGAGQPDEAHGAGLCFDYGCGRQSDLGGVGAQEREARLRRVLASSSLASIVFGMFDPHRSSFLRCSCCVVLAHDAALPA